MLLTCIAPYVPFDGIEHAGGAYFNQFLSALARDHEVNLIAPGLDVNRQMPARRTPEVGIHRVRLSPVSRTRLVRAATYPFDLLDGVTVGTLLLRAVRHDQVARELVRSSDVIEIHWSRCLPLVPWVRRLAPTAVVTAWEYDVMYQSIARRADHASSFRLRFESRATRRIVRHKEPRLLNQCDTVFVFSNKDRVILEGLGVQVPMHVVDPLVVFPDNPPGPSKAPTALFVGAMDRAENAEGILWFLDHVWPGVVRGVPSARLIVAGSNPPAELRARADEYTQITGYVDTLDPYYRSARLMIVPLKMGAGVKFKVPQAMAYGLPVLTTNVGAEGVGDRSGHDIFVGIKDSAEEWVRLATWMLTDLEAAQAVGVRALEWVRHTYDFEASTKKVIDQYRRLAHR